MQNNTSKDSYLHEIPLYEKLEGDDKKHIDQVIADNPVTNPDEASIFGDHVMDATRDVSQQIIQAMQSEENGAMREPLQACVDDMRGIDLENLQDKVGTIVNKGANYARKNPKTTAVIAGGLVTGQFWLSALAGGSTGIKNYVQQKKNERAGIVDMDQVEDQIKSAIATTSKHMQNLEFAERKVPVLMDRINALGKTNGDTFHALTEYICAGREILKRLKENDLAEATAESENNSNFDTSKRLGEVNETIEVMDHKLVVMEQMRQDSVLETMHLAEMGSAIRKNQLSVRSLLTSEVPAMQRTIAVAGLALDTHSTTRLTEEFRDHIDRTKDSAAIASQQASEAARLGRADSPERLQIAIDRTVAAKNRIENLAVIEQQMSEDIAKKRLELEKRTADLVVASNKNSQDAALPSPEQNDVMQIEASSVIDEPVNTAPPAPAAALKM